MNPHNTSEQLPRTESLGYAFFACPDIKTSNFWDWAYYFFATDYWGWVWLTTFLSQAWITLHIWRPENQKLASTDQGCNSVVL